MLRQIKKALYKEQVIANWLYTINNERSVKIYTAKCSFGNVQFVVPEKEIDFEKQISAYLLNKWINNLYEIDSEGIKLIWRVT